MAGLSSEFSRPVGLGLRALLLPLAAALFLAVASNAGAALYWANAGDSTIGRANLDGTGANHGFVSELDYPCGVAVDGSHVYWADSNANAIGRASLDGTGKNQAFITGASAPCAVAVDRAHVYWANSDAGTIGRANLNGTQANQSFIIGADAPCGLAVDRSHVYWGSERAGTIGRANLDGTRANQRFVSGADAACGLAADETYIYWANYGVDGFGTTIGRAKLDGTRAEQNFISGADQPCGLAVDGTHLYWANQEAGTIGRANVDGTRANQSFIAGADLPCGVAVRRAAFDRPRGDDRTPPRGSALRLRPRAFRPTSRGASVAGRRRTGTRVAFHLSEAASVRFRVERRVRAGRGRGRCTSKDGSNSLYRCIRYRRLLGSFSVKGVPGPNRLRFTGRLRGRSLRAGRYRLVAVPTDAAANQGRPFKARFRILKRPRRRI